MGTRQSENPESSAAESTDPTKASLRDRLAPLLRVLRYVLILAVVAFATWYFASMWDTVVPALQQMNPWWVALSALVLLVGLSMNALAWVTLLHGLGHEVPLIRSAQIMLVGQLGKYVPGSAWAYLMQMEIGRQYGIARARVLVTSLYAAGVGVVASLVLAALALPQISAQHPELLWLFALLPIGLACLHPRVMTLLANLVLKVFRRPPLEHRVTIGTTIGALAWSIGSYVVYGLHIWLLAGGSLAITDVVLCAAALGIGFTASLFAFLLPSGVGVREAVLIGSLGLVMAAGEASAIALVSRGLFTAGDLLTAGIASLAALAMRRRLRRLDAATAEYEDVVD